MAKALPQRMCVACRTQRPKNELVRIVRDQTGAVSLDLSGRKPGRGAYICKSIECLEKARKTKALERALGSIDEQTFAAIKDAMEGSI